MSNILSAAASRLRILGIRRDQSEPVADREILRVPADETTSVSFTVNGQPATVVVAPRVTLADALRDHLALTGTHLGCEHGVCGMCTVIVDGDAARACLLLACQMEGSEILTVEGLGRQDDLHPLQESFGRHHALQCGFCTPGQLMSAFDLLTHEPEVDVEELPRKLSGVLCRCTGYRSIVAAVGEVASTHRAGISEPRNCASQAHLPRVTTGGLGHPTLALSGEPVDGTAEILLPQGEPTVHVEVVDTVQSSPEDLWAVMQDTERLARCLPGAELLHDFGEDRYQGRIQVSLGPVKLSFLGDIHVIERDEQDRSIRALAQAADAGGGEVKADVLLRVVGAPHGSVIRAEADLHMVGRIAQFGRALAGDVSKDMFGRFTAGLDAATRGEEIEAAPPASAVGMAWHMATARTRAAITRWRRDRT